ncbi:MAG: siphovirus Gp157 family protein [Betaproteobacteria bacterium]
MNLFQLSEQERSWFESLTLDDGDGNPISEEESARLIAGFVAADDAFKDKLDRYVELIEGFGARASYRECKAARLAELARRDEMVAEKLKARVKAVMELRGETRIETDDHRLRVCANGGKAPLVVPEDWRTRPANAPEKFHKHRIELDVTQIRAELESGAEIEGCAIGERGTHLRIA